MPQERLSNEKFLESLGSLLTTTTTSNSGSVFLTQKTLAVSEGSQKSPQILIRATNGAATAKPKTKANVKIAKEKAHKQTPKIKLATIVDSADLESFYTKYADVCKKGMEGLRKRDKKKAKEKAKAKKKKGTTTT